MPNDVVPNRQFLGRPFKPVALGVTIIMIGLVAIPTFNMGDSGRDLFDWASAAVAAASATLLTFGWWANRIRFAEWGLAVGIFAYLLRLTHLLVTQPQGDSALLALGVLVIVAGSYILEANDRRIQEWTR